jgi:hypothetical protein
MLSVPASNTQSLADEDEEKERAAREPAAPAAPTTAPSALSVLVRERNGDEHQRRGNKSGKFWSDFDEVRRPVTLREMQV